VPIDIINSKTGRFPFDTTNIKLEIKYTPFEVITIPDPENDNLIKIVLLDDLNKLKTKHKVKSIMVKLPVKAKIGKKKRPLTKRKLIVCKDKKINKNLDKINPDLI